MRMSVTSDQSTTDTAEELLSQLVEETTDMADELDTTSSNSLVSGRKSGEGGMTNHAAGRRPLGKFVIRCLLVRHELYPRVISLYYACKKLSCNATEAKALETEETAYLSKVERLQCDAEVRAALNQPRAVHAKLDLFMKQRVQMMESLKSELDSCRRSLNKAGELIDQQLSDILSRASCMTDLTPPEEGSSRSAMMSSDPRSPADPNDAIPTPKGAEPPKRKASTNASERMKADLMKKRKKGKLPRHATEAMKEWWDANSGWPYPTEVEKKKLLDQTDLDINQLNNWFINQRKRHWNGKGPS